MYRLSSIIIPLLLGFIPILAQSPHGDELQMDCAQCHNASGWTVDYQEVLFDHGTTDFPLEGVHAQTDCRECHSSMILSQVAFDCVSCHSDVHSMSVGNDCARCHSSESWLVYDIPEIHEENGFPLMGAHANLSCVECHLGETNLQFNRIGNECIACHQQDYVNAENPNHEAVGYSTDCLQCHSPLAPDWRAQTVTHDFFPLTKGHNIQDCNACHIGNTFAGLSPDCVNCHLQDFQTAMNPDHQQLNFTTDCASCHSLEPDWKPANFREHDALYFPIYSGEHNGEWDSCTDCHQNPNNYADFTCLTCHKRGDTDGEHDDVPGYVYESNACLVCHPTGSEDGAFDHNSTNFPLTEAHIGVDCNACHINGYAGTPTDCFACHEADFNASRNPDHNVLGLSTDCASCHTAAPDWMPAKFDIHNQYYVLNGAHAAIANDCVACHNGDYNNTPNTCIGCHKTDFDNTTNPNHVSANFSTDCLLCHTESAWEPSTFDHDGLYFPIYSGAHNGEWDQCTDCHTNTNNYAIFTCITCHTRGDTDDEHNDVQGYLYESNACLACHPNP